MAEDRGRARRGWAPFHPRRRRRRGPRLAAVNDFRKLCALEGYAPTDNVSELTARINDEGWETRSRPGCKTSRLSAADALLIFSVGGGSREHGVSMNLVRAIELAKAVRRRRLRQSSASPTGPPRRRPTSRSSSDPRRPRYTPHVEALSGRGLAPARLPSGAGRAARASGSRRAGKVSEPAPRSLPRPRRRPQRPGPRPAGRRAESLRYRPDDVRCCPGARGGGARLATPGFALVVASNQPAAAKGSGHARRAATPSRPSATCSDPAPPRRSLDWRYCLHHPDARRPGLRALRVPQAGPGHAARRRRRWT